MKKWLFWALILCPYLSQASLNLSPLGLDDLGSIKPQSIGQTLVFTKSNNEVWSNKADGSGSFQLKYNESPIEALQLLTYGNYVYIENLDGVYKTDGVSVTLVTTTGIGGLFLSSSNALVGKINAENDLLIFSGDSVQTLSMDDLSVNNNPTEIHKDGALCLFDSDTAIVKNFWDKQLYYNDAGIHTLIEGYEGARFEAYFENHCYFGFRTDKGVYSILRINAQGNVELIDEESNIHITSVFRFNEKLYALRGLSDIFEITTDSSTSVFIHTIQGETLHPYSTSSSNEFLYLFSANPCDAINFPHQKCTPIPPGPTQLIVLNHDFEIVDQFLGSYGEPYNATILDDAEMLLINNQSLDRIYEITDGQFGNSASDANFDFLNIIGGSDGKYFLHAKNKVSNQFEVFLISSQPVISHHLSGLWFDPELKNQGISIQTGIRPDGSEYLFSSLYLFKEGKPFWLAGNSDIANGEDQILVELFNYKGSSHFIDNGTAENSQELFGSIKFMPQSCNIMNVEFNFVDDSQPVFLELQKIINTDTDFICSDSGEVK